MFVQVTSDYREGLRVIYRRAVCKQCDRFAGTRTDTQRVENREKGISFANLYGTFRAHLDAVIYSRPRFMEIPANRRM